MSDTDKKHTISNIIGSMKKIETEKRLEIIYRQLSHFFRADESLGTAVAQGLDVDVKRVVHGYDAASKEAKRDKVTVEKK
jgi:catalase